jgi:ubiquinol-cytochrome c reductase cytochrome c1 subunit
MVIANAAIVGAGLAYCALKKSNGEEADFWFFRDDIGAFWGIHGYEEQVSEVGTHHGHNSWPQYRFPRGLRCWFRQTWFPGFR